MKTEEILNLDCRKKENEIKIQKVLRKIKPLSRYSNEDVIPLEALEKLLMVFNRKYNVYLQWITVMYDEKTPIYKGSIKTTDNHVWLGSAYGVTIYELFAKLCIKIYSDIKSKKISKKEN